jgi:dUTP pyrophosphatase
MKRSLATHAHRIESHKNSNLSLCDVITLKSAAYDLEAAEDTVIPSFKLGQKPTLIPTGLKAYCMEDECYLLLNRSSGPKKGFLMANSVGLIDSDYYENPDNDGHFFFAYFNCSDHDVEIKKGDVIGQVVFTKYLVVDNDNATGERKGGFGSTDNK